VELAGSEPKPLIPFRQTVVTEKGLLGSAAPDSRGAESGLYAANTE
jgi:hypothetical protein